MLRSAQLGDGVSIRAGFAVANSDFARNAKPSMSSYGDSATAMHSGDSHHRTYMISHVKRPAWDKVGNAICAYRVGIEIRLNPSRN